MVIYINQIQIASQMMICNNGMFCIPISYTFYTWNLNKNKIL